MNKSFGDQRDYWNDRHQRGRSSGAGSIGLIREWKWAVIQSTTSSRVDHVIDYGCGDLSFWGNYNCEDYVGIDVSPAILERNRKLRPGWQFYTPSSVGETEPRPIVLCLDVLFHILPEKDFTDILENLCSLSTRYIFVYTWKMTPFSFSYLFRQAVRERRLEGVIKALRYLKNSDTDGKYEKFRPMSDYFTLFERRGFINVDTLTRVDDLGAMYIFEKRT
ncbi:MAG: hypothetical protein NTV61_03635 [Candidatus Bathyarchaeota archaeon]|nr:hypothetical protein [Candidatus Bathyarchaeota archaeon]